MIFGNLTFSHYAPDTEAERQVLSLQAALVALSTADKPSSSLRKLLRLKKAMQKNKLRKYTFVLSPVKQLAAGALPIKEQEASDCLEVLSSVIKEVTGCSVKTTEVKLATSGHRLLSLVLEGKQILPAPAVIKTNVTSLILSRHGDLILSFVLQSCTLTILESVTTLSIQCVYKVNDAQKKDSVSISGSSP